jgi:hypothetical protein
VLGAGTRVEAVRKCRLAPTSIKRRVYRRLERELLITPSSLNQISANSITKWMPADRAIPRVRQ